MRKLITIVGLVALLGTVSVGPVLADEEQSVTASVTVTEFIDVTVTDHGDTGLHFGSLSPGVLKQPETAAPSITVSLAAGGNTDVDVSLKGADFSDGISANFSADNAFWNTTDAAGVATAMSTGYAAVGTLTPGNDLDIYHWLSIPSGQDAASYTSTFTYKTAAA